jgi:3-deoxy-7-phosphoheptulonate synthase
MQHNTDNVRIISSAPMVSPNTLIDKLPLSEKAASGVVSSRNTIKNILYGNDNRLMVLVGPCSIHDTKAAMEYAKKLLKLKEELSEHLFIVMRVILKLLVIFLNPVVLKLSGLVSWEWEQKLNSYLTF